MKNLKNKITLLFVALSFSGLANWPENSFLLFREKTKAVEFESTARVFARKNRSMVNQAVYASPVTSVLNEEYITGQTKKAESDIARMLNWNFKVKFRINRNMNIIFSYN